MSPKSKKQTLGGKEGGDDKKVKKMSKMNTEIYKIDTFEMLKQVHPDIGISSEAMSILESFINNVFEKLVDESAKLTRYNKNPATISHEIQTCFRHILSGDDTKHSVSKGTKAITKFTST